MAYGKPQIRPQRSMKKIQPKGTELTEKVQQGKNGLQGANKMHLEWGGMPSSGNFADNAGDSMRMEGGHSAGQDGAMHGAGGKAGYSGSAHAEEGTKPSHEQGKKPKHPGSHGGPRTGSIDTMTKLFFHPKGGFDNKGMKATRKSPMGSGGYKDSGPKTGIRVTGVNK